MRILNAERTMLDAECWTLSRGTVARRVLAGFGPTWLQKVRCVFCYGCVSSCYLPSSSFLSACVSHKHGRGRSSPYKDQLALSMEFCSFQRWTPPLSSATLSKASGIVAARGSIACFIDTKQCLQSVRLTGDSSNKPSCAKHHSGQHPGPTLRRQTWHIRRLADLCARQTWQYLGGPRIIVPELASCMPRQGERWSCGHEHPSKMCYVWYTRYAGHRPAQRYYMPLTSCYTT